MAKTGKRRKDHYDFRATPGGIIYVCALVLIGLAAVNTQRSLLFIIFGLMVGVFFVSVAMARLMLSAVDGCRDMPERAFADQVVYLGYHFRHRRRRGSAVGLEVGEVRPPERLESVGAYCLHLPPGGQFKSGSRFAVRRRGRYALSAIRVSTRFPMSLLRARRDIRAPCELVVWPALGELCADVLTRGAAEMSDTAPARAQSGSDEFFGLREYRQGDNPRWIHWRRTAATGAPVVREMSRPRPDVLFVLLDTHVPKGWPAPLAEGGTGVRPVEEGGTGVSPVEKGSTGVSPVEKGSTGVSPVEKGSTGVSPVETRERLIRFAATLAEHYFRKDYRVGLALACGGGVRALSPAAGRGQRIAVLDALADVDDNDQWPFGRLLSALPPRLLRQAYVVVIGPDQRRLGNLVGLRAACRRLLTVTPDNLDLLFEDAPAAGDNRLRASDFRLQVKPEEGTACHTERQREATW